MTIGGLNGVKNGHSIDPAVDEDWINFWNSSLKVVTIETNGSGDSDTEMWLYNKNGEEVAYNDDGGVEYFSKISQTLDSGTYYIKIQSYSNSETIINYNVEIK